uniref:ATP synthase mitochondrial F1 complex assembly factor 2 n=1 Tax=Caenorhabditis japonica TaxID=281687 RepID=A0A8R1DHV7_CAEJA
MILDSYPLALAIAEEWSSQDEHLQLGQMRLTGLAFTAQDNPLEQSADTISRKILDYVDGDTVLFFNTESSKLHRYQEENWAPLIRNLNTDLGTKVRASESILDCDVASAEDKSKIERWVRQHNFPALIGLQYATESVKSFVVAYNALRHHIDAETAIDAATLEQRTQAETWGSVEWAHGLEREELITRLSAASLFVYFNSNNFSTKEI